MTSTRPVHEFRIGAVKAAIWKNETDNGPRYNTTFSRIYKNGDGKWKSTSSFGRDDLLLVAKVADQAHTFICGFNTEQVADTQQQESQEQHDEQQQDANAL